MALLCRHKQRFRTVAEAEAGRLSLIESVGQRGSVAPRFRAFYCDAHACYHLGHDRPRDERRILSPDEAILRDVLRLLAPRERELIAAYGTTRDPAAWRGVGVLHRMTRHLTAKAQHCNPSRGDVRMRHDGRALAGQRGIENRSAGATSRRPPAPR